MVGNVILNVQIIFYNHVFLIFHQILVYVNSKVIYKQKLSLYKTSFLFTVTQVPFYRTLYTSANRGYLPHPVGYQSRKWGDWKTVGMVPWHIAIWLIVVLS